MFDIRPRNRERKPRAFVAASLLGARPAVWLGGIVTPLIVATAAWRAPELRRLKIGAYLRGP